MEGLHGVCTDGALLVTGIVRGFIAKVREVNPEVSAHFRLCLADRYLHQIATPHLTTVVGFVSGTAF